MIENLLNSLAKYQSEEDYRKMLEDMSRAPAGFFPPDSYVEPYEPGPTEKTQAYLTNLLGNKYSAKGLTDVLSFAPVSGNILGYLEGKELEKKGSPGLGSLIQALSVAIPGGKSRVIEGVKPKVEPLPKVTATKVQTTDTNPDFGDLQRDGFELVGGLPTFSRTNFNSNAEFRLATNLTFPKANKKYNVEDLIKNTISTAPPSLRNSITEQFDDFVSSSLRGKKATKQELLDDMGKNTPVFKENYMNDPDAYVRDATNMHHGRYLPNIPGTNTTPDSLFSASLLNKPTSVVERSFSYTHPKYATLDNPIHPEVGLGSVNITANRSDIITNTPGLTNSKNRVFHSRGAIYDDVGEEGERVYIAGEGQSGVYGRNNTVKTAEDYASKRSRFSTSDDGPLAGILRDADSAQPNYIGDYDLDPFLARTEFKDTIEDLTKTRADEIKNIQEAEALAAGFRGGMKEVDGIKSKYSRLFTEFTEGVDPPPSFTQVQNKINAVDNEILDQFNRVQDLENQIQFRTIEINRNYNDLIKPLLKGGTQVADGKIPLVKEWFPLHMKTSMNEAIEQGADSIYFPVNDYAVAKQTGQRLQPERVRQYKYRTDSFEEGESEELLYTPGETAQGLAPFYRQETKRGVKRIEDEYGIKLNAETIMDDNNNEFVKIALTPEIKEALKRILYNRGGLVTMMPLKYGI
tara:strand:+ start:485 stop:2551 length:2067 start_codon:yes stop_codon:yes gene_type:complete